MAWFAIWNLVRGIGWRGWLALAICAALAFAAWRIDANAYARGAAAEVARQQAANARLQGRYDAAAAHVRDLSAKIEAYEEASRKIGRDIENEFRADPDAGRRTVNDADRVRLRRWWAGENPATP